MNREIINTRTEGFKLYIPGKTTLSPGVIYLTIRRGLEGIYMMKNTWSSGDWEGQVLDGSDTIYYKEFEEKDVREANKAYIKDRIFKVAQEMYQEGLASCDPRYHEEGSKKHQEAYEEIIYRLQDYEAFCYDQTPDLSFDDYYVDRKKNN